MTRAVFRKMIARALALILVTLAFLLVMNMITNRRLESEKQADLKSMLGDVLSAERYSEISITPYLENNPTIQTAYSAFDSQGRILGYVIEVKDETETGDLLTKMSFSPDGGTLLSLRVLDNSEQGKENEGIRASDFITQFEGIRLPAALLADLPEQDLSSNEYPPIAGLTDGTFREQLDDEDEAGYRDFVEIIVKSGRIVGVTWDAIQTDGGNNRAKASVDGEFVLANNSVIWAAQAYAMQNKLIEVQDPAKIAIKSDGTTEVVTDVSVSVNAFLKLSNKCIEDSKNGLPAASVTPSAPAPDEGNTDVTSAAAPTSATDGNTAGSAGIATGTASDPTKETTESYAGSEDGVVQSYQGGALPDTIDGLHAAEIKTKINEAPGARQSSRTVVSTVNYAYIFLQEYLEGGGMTR